MGLRRRERGRECGGEGERSWDEVGVNFFMGRIIRLGLKIRSKFERV